MSLFSFKKKDGVSPEVLICDIGNGSVGVAHVHIAPNKKPKILVLHRTQFSLVTNATMEVLTEEMKKALETALTELNKKIHARNLKNLPDEAWCFLSSPWAFSEARSITYDKPEDFKVTKDLINNLKNSLLSDLEKELREDSEQNNSSFEIIFEEFGSTKLNGYSTKKPEGKTARFVNLSGFAGMSQKPIRKDISTLIGRMFPHIRRTEYIPAIFAYYKGIEEVVIVPKDYVFFDIRSEVTDVAVIREEQLAYTGSFPFGMRSVFRVLAQDFKTDPLEAENRVSLFYEKKLSDTSTRALKEALSRLEDEWDTYVRDMTHSVSLYGAMPSTVLYASEGGYERFAKDIVRGTFAGGLPGKRTSSNWFHFIDLPLNEYIETSEASEIDHFLFLSSLFVRFKAQNK